MKRNFIFLCFLIGLLVLFSCAPSRIVRPYNKGEQSVGVNIGGPLVEFGSVTVPLPLSSISYSRGVSDKTTLFGGVHVTSLLFGVFQSELGGCHELFYSDSLKLGLSITPVVNMAYDKWEGNFKFWPQFDVNAYWELKREKSYIYLGIDNWFEMETDLEHGRQQQKQWLFSPHVGFTYVRNKWNYSVESKWLVPNVSTRPNVVKYRGVSGKGAVGFFLNFTRQF